MTTLTPGTIFTLDGRKYMVQDFGAPWSLEMPSASMLRFEVTEGDHFSPDPVSKNRSEIAMQGVIADGTPINVAYGLVVEPGATNTASFCMLGQFHQAQGTDVAALGPPFAIGLVGEKMIVSIAYTDAAGAPVTQTIFMDSSDIVRGHNYAIDVQVTFDPNGNGHLVVTRDGLTLVSYTGPLGYQGENGVYWKEGIYRAAAPETMAADFSNLSLTTSTPTGSGGGTGSVVDSYTQYDSAGHKTSTITVYADGSTKTDKYDQSGGLSQSTTTHADGSRDVYDYGVTGHNYVSDHRVYDAGGTLTQFVAVAADGSKTVSDYAVSGKSYSTDQLGYNASGVLISAVYYGTDGSVTTDKYNASGALTQYGVTHADGSRDVFDYGITGQNYVSDPRVYNAAGTLTEFVGFGADGSRIEYDYAVTDKSYASDVLNYSTKGLLTSAIYYNTDGSTTTDKCNAAGATTQRTIVHADASRDVYDYGVTGQSYVTDHRVYNSAGTLTQFIGTGADGSRLVDDYAVTGKSFTSDQMTYSASGVQVTAIYHDIDGSTTSNKYGSTGSLTQSTVAHANGARDVYDYGITGQSYVADHRVYNAAGTLTEFVTIASSGAEKAIAYATGLKLAGSAGNDVFSSYGGDSFVFKGTFGSDVVNYFHAGDAANHDVLQLTASAVADFAHLHMAQSGSNVVITIDAHDTVTLVGAKLAALTSHDFLFS